MTPASLSQGSNHLLLTRFPNKTFQEYDPELFEVAHSFFFLNDSTYFVEGGFYFLDLICISDQNNQNSSTQKKIQ